MAGSRGDRLPITIALALVVVGAALALRLGDIAAGRLPFGPEWFPSLFAAGGWVAAALLIRRTPPLAWFATVAAAAIAAVEVVGVVREQQTSLSSGAWPVAVAGSVAALLAASGIAAGYALHGPSAPGPVMTRSPWRVLVLVGLAVTTVVAAFAAAAAMGGATPGGDRAGVLGDAGAIRTSWRFAVAFIAVASLGGLWADLRGPIARARARGGGLAEFPRALADEILPTSAAMRRRGVEDERARLAAELHARVLPDLRRAAEAAAATSTPADPLAIGLRHAVEDVEELMHGRQSVVLEEYGLVAALEWLAERTQQRRPLVVEVELDGAAVDDPAAITKPVARAAFRVAQLAVDNAVRHAESSRVVLRLTVDAAHLELAIEDDGIGFDLGRRRQAGRGLADMRAAAAEISGTIRVEPASPGTVVTLVCDRGGPAGGASRSGVATPGR